VSEYPDGREVRGVYKAMKNSKVLAEHYFHFDRLPKSHADKNYEYLRELIEQWLAKQEQEASFEDRSQAFARGKDKSFANAASSEDKGGKSGRGNQDVTLIVSILATTRPEVAGRDRGPMTLRSPSLPGSVFACSTTDLSTRMVRRLVIEEISVRTNTVC
jgi:hypothetical protein